MLLQVYRFPTLLLLLPTLLLAELLTWGFVIVRDRPNWSNKFKAYLDVARSWPAAMAKRRLNQTQRKNKDRVLLKLTTFRLDFDQVSNGALSHIAAGIFNPLVWILRKFILALVWW